MTIFGRSKRRNIETRLAFLRSGLGPGETEVFQARGWERVATGEAAIVMLVTGQRVLWTYAKGPSDLVLDISFDDVVAFLGSEGEGGFILEAAEPRYREIGAGQTTLALFRLADRESAVEIVRFVEQRIPPAARSLIPDVDGTGRHESYPSSEDSMGVDSRRALVQPAAFSRPTRSTGGSQR